MSSFLLVESFFQCEGEELPGSRGVQLPNGAVGQLSGRTGGLPHGHTGGQLPGRTGGQIPGYKGSQLPGRPGGHFPAGGGGGKRNPCESTKQKCSKKMGASKPKKSLRDVVMEGNSEEVSDEAQEKSLEKMKNIKSKTKKKKQKGASKLMRSLRDDEVQGNKCFQENIDVRDGFFYCKICSKFSTTTKLQARAHVLSCGKARKKGRPTKCSTCLQCNEKFGSKQEMHKHHFREHSSQSYCCSTCHRTFTRRQAYARHLVVHKEPPQLQCPEPGCKKVFRYKCDVKRHFATHKAVVHVVKSDEEDQVDFEIDLEEKKVGGIYAGSLSVKVLPSANSTYLRNHTSFQDNFGFRKFGGLGLLCTIIQPTWPINFGF